MRGRPPKKRMTAEQERAASAFVSEAEAPSSGSGRGSGSATESGAQASGGERPETPLRAISAPSGASERPWEASRVREDVVKGYALRLPEPLFLQAKWVAAEKGVSMNELCRTAISEVVREHLGE